MERSQLCSPAVMSMLVALRVAAPATSRSKAVHLPALTHLQPSAVWQGRRLQALKMVFSIAWHKHDKDTTKTRQPLARQRHYNVNTCFKCLRTTSTSQYQSFKKLYMGSWSACSPVNTWDKCLRTKINFKLVECNETVHRDLFEVQPGQHLLQVPLHKFHLKVFERNETVLRKMYTSIYTHQQDASRYMSLPSLHLSSPSPYVIIAINVDVIVLRRARQGMPCRPAPVRSLAGEGLSPEGESPPGPGGSRGERHYLSAT